MRETFIFIVDDGVKKWEEEADASSRYDASQKIGLQLAHKGITALSMKFLYSKKTERGHHGRDEN